jgi:hypothetical protein
MAKGLLVIERILRDRDGIWNQIGEERDLSRLIRDMLFSSTLALACYGAVLGAFSDSALLQAPISAIKLPLLFLVTLAICLPTLYLFNLVFGARLQVKQALALVMVAITVISMLAFAFAPISLFFLITANQYSFYKVLNVAILALSAVVGLRFLTQGMAALNRHNEDRDLARRTAAALAEEAERKALEKLAEPAAEISAGTSGEKPTAKAGEDQGTGKELVPAGAVATLEKAPNGRPQDVPAELIPGWTSSPPPPDKQASMGLLYVWILLFGFVGTQLAWTLRPFFGSPDRDFSIFRSIDGNFYVDIVRTIGNLF